MIAPSIKTKRFFLRPLSTIDVTERYLGWLKDLNSNRFIQTASSDHTLESLKNYVKARQDREDILFLGIFLKEDGLHIGNIKFEPIDYINRTTIMGVLIGDLDWLGKGVFFEVINACAEWLSRNYSLNTIFLGVDIENRSAIRAYLKAGFRFVNDNPTQSTNPNGLKMARQHTSAHRLALGTVQFGMPYGIGNTTGKVNINEGKKILEHAWAAGIGTLDTAFSYGESEALLGECGIEQWQVISKIPAIPEDCDQVYDWVHNTVISSLKRLQCDFLYGLLLHRPEQLIGENGQELYHALLDLKKRGLVKKIGISIYHPLELNEIIPKFAVDIVQAPFNIIDRRLLTSGWLRKLHMAGIEVQVRSIFLQGLLLMDERKRPEKFSRWSTLWENWHGWLREEGLTSLQACLGFALSYPEVNRVIFGVDSVNQLKEILAAADTNIPIPPSILETNDLDLIIPSRWEALTP